MKEEKVTNKKQTQKVDETIEDIVGQDPQEEKQQTKKDTNGVVFNCPLLYVRKTPDKDGSVVAIIAKGDKVKIDTSKSTDLFYSISSKDGTIGFCRKQFIKVY